MLEYYLQKKYIFLRQRWKTPFAEIDLVFSYPSLRRRLLLVEVKKQAHKEFRRFAVSPRQKKRIANVVQWLSEFDFEVEVTLAFVDRDSKIESEALF